MLKKLLLAGAALALTMGSASAKELNAIGITVGNLGNPFFVTLAKGAEAKAKEINPDVKVNTADASYDLVYASHVLEHIRDDEAALREIRRILRPRGLAVLPVPIVAPATVEYPAPSPFETFHVRAPGADYFDRYRRHFARVDVHGSGDFDPRHQLFVHEDRSGYPSARMPHRPPMAGDRHPDYVPVCWV